MIPNAFSCHPAADEDHRFHFRAFSFFDGKADVSSLNRLKAQTCPFSEIRIILHSIYRISQETCYRPHGIDRQNQQIRSHFLQIP